MIEEKAKPCFVGIDVSKHKLDICIVPQKEYYQVENKDFAGVCELLSQYTPELIVMECTGGYEDAVFKALAQAGFRVRKEHAQKIYHHGKSIGRRAKTDLGDAFVIADYARKNSEDIPNRALKAKKQEQLQKLSLRREDLLAMQTSEKNRIKAPALDPMVKASCERILDSLSQEILHIEALIQELIAQDSEWKEKIEIMETMPGIGSTTASILLAHLPELGNVTHKQIAALVGVAPYQHESGQYKGETHIYGGRPIVRNCLYMANLSGIRFNKRIKPFYDQLAARGKAKKVAITACMNKMLRILNAMLAKKEKFQAEPS